jgi:hypothetical protein
MEETLQDTGICNDFLNRTVIAQETLARINKRNNSEETAFTMGEHLCQLFL